MTGLSRVNASNIFSQLEEIILTAGMTRGQKKTGECFIVPFSCPMYQFSFPGNFGLFCFELLSPRNET
jgi:hypothetical protein